MRLSISTLALLLFSLSASLAEGLPDFSGVYVRTWPKPEVHQGKAVPVRMTVAQNGRVLTTTLTEKGRTRTSTYYLDGTQSENLAVGGAPSSDKAQIKFDSLLINSLIQVRATTLEVEQKWHLSSDYRHLMIQITAGASNSTTKGFELGSWENVYRRVAVSAKPLRTRSK
jgi:hypothetical protein